MLWSAALLVSVLSGCTLLGTLPYDPMETPPDPEGSRLKPSVGWLGTHGSEAPGPPDGSVAVEVVHIEGRTYLQQVRHIRNGDAWYGDSILLYRSTLRPFATWRWTARGTYVTRYNNRVVERVFEPLRGPARRSIETMDITPYSALGMELLVAALPLGEGYHGMIPVAVDTVARGWSWLHFEVETERSIRERPDQLDRETWIVDCDIGPEKTRLFIVTEGRSVRRMQRLGPGNEVLSEVHRTLLGGGARKPAN